MRIAGITIPEKKKVKIGLTAVYGIGPTRAKKVLETAGVDPEALVSDLTDKQQQALRSEIEKFSIEGDLKRQISLNVKRLKDIKTYRGLRHSKSMPARGQRTKTNSRTVRGNVRKTMGSGRRKIEKT